MHMMKDKTKKKVLFWVSNLMAPACVVIIFIMQFSFAQRQTYMFEGTSEADCHDGVDNDNDDRVDHQDSDCPVGCGPSSSSSSDYHSSEYSSGYSSESSSEYSSSSEGYSSSGEYSSSSIPLVENNCHDDVDNDGDSLTDCQDADDCALSGYCAENCTNMMDDDGDLQIDCNDSYCSSDPACD